jgi:hypothetical protein
MVLSFEAARVNGCDGKRNGGERATFWSEIFASSKIG